MSSSDGAPDGLRVGSLRPGGRQRPPGVFISANASLAATPRQPRVMTGICVADGGARLLVAAQDAGTGGTLVRLPLPGAMGRYLRGTEPDAGGARHGAETFRGWLENNADSL